MGQRWSVKKAKYKPCLPKHNDNVSHNHPLREFFTLLAGLAGIILVIYWLLGVGVDVAVDHIPPAKEEALFAKVNFPWKINQQNNSKDQNRLQVLTDQLRQCLSVAYPVKVRIVESPVANAFAYPGGYMVVYSGLLKKVKSENGIAFVLAHELAHFQNRDHLRGMGRGIVMMAISGLLTGPDSKISAILAPTGQLGQAHYSQKREMLADKTAISALQCYYGHVGGAEEFFSVIAQERHEIPGHEFIQPFASHPELQKRLEEMEKAQQENGWKMLAVTPY